jgi:hypothetical protein
LLILFFCSIFDSLSGSDSASIKKWKVLPDGAIPASSSPTQSASPSLSLPARPVTTPSPEPPKASSSTKSSKHHKADKGDKAGHQNGAAIVNMESSKTITKGKIAKVKSSTVLLSPSTSVSKFELPSANSAARRSSKESHPESVRVLMEKIESLVASQKILFQNSAAYSSKLEGLEFVNKSMFLKIDQMMDTMEESFKVRVLMTLPAEVLIYLFIRYFYLFYFISSSQCSNRSGPWRTRTRG